MREYSNKKNKIESLKILRSPQNCRTRWKKNEEERRPSCVLRKREDGVYIGAQGSHKREDGVYIGAH